MRVGTIATMAAALLGSSLLGACAHRQSGAEMLTQCWQARPTGRDGEYVVHIVGSSGQGEHAGGIFARTNACPPRIMLAIPGSPKVAEAFERAGDRAEYSFFYGFEADAKVRVKDVHKNGLDVVLEQVGPIRTMQQTEFVAFLKRFHLA